MSADDPYVYPGTSVLRNRLNTQDPDFLDKQERALVALRMRRDIPRGAFDLTHLRAIHRHLFQDVYDWAGELRTVEISKRRQQAGHRLDLTRIAGKRWIAASIASHAADYRPMAEVIADALAAPRRGR